MPKAKAKHLDHYINIAEAVGVIETFKDLQPAIAIGGSPAAVIGTLLARRVGRHHKDYYAEQIKNGGILLWVRTFDDKKRDLAVKILKGHSGRDVHVHDWSEP